MSTDRKFIPVCHSEFLQDVTIALGHHSLKSIRYQYSSLRFEVKYEDNNSVPRERLDIEARSRSGRLMSLTLWEDGTAWVYFRKGRDKLSVSEAFSVHSDFSDMHFEDLAGLLHATLRDLTSVRNVWEQRVIRT